MGKSVTDAVVNNEIFRKDFPDVIALRADLAILQPVRLKLNNDGWLAGQVLVRDSGDGLFGKYSALSGSGDASLVLAENVPASDQPATGGASARGISSGYLKKEKLIDYDSGAKDELGAREILDASGATIVKF